MKMFVWSDNLKRIKGEPREYGTTLVLIFAKNRDSAWKKLTAKYPEIKVDDSKMHELDENADVQEAGDWYE